MASMAFPRNVNPFELVMYKMLSTKKLFVNTDNSILNLLDLLIRNTDKESFVL